MKRIVSFVPSWTETLIEAGANVVGRTRFCVHPKDVVSSIEAIGGTKSFDLEQLRRLKPDLIVMDREENTREIAEQASLIAPVVATHVESFADLPRELRVLANACECSKLEDFALRAENLPPALVLQNHQVPAILKTVSGQPSTQTPFVYVIWKDPWMSVNRATFIASMLERVGFDLTQMTTYDVVDKYPKLENLPTEALILLSSEPYAFAKKTPQLPQENIAIVDGESYSWFGLRAIRFLERLQRESAGQS